MARLTFDSTEALKQVQRSLQKIFADKRTEIIDAAVAEFKESLEARMPDIGLAVERLIDGTRHGQEVVVHCVWKETT